MKKEIKRILKEYKSRGLYLEDAADEIIAVFEEQKNTSPNTSYTKCTIELYNYICDLEGELSLPYKIESILKKHFA